MGPLEKHLYVSINGKVRNRSEKGEGMYMECRRTMWFLIEREFNCLRIITVNILKAVLISKSGMFKKSLDYIIIRLFRKNQTQL